MSWSRICKAAKAIIDAPEGIEVVEHMRELDRAATNAGYGLEEPFLTIKGLASQLDDVPSSKSRYLWNQKALSEIDSRTRAWLDEVRPQLLRACHQLLAEFGSRTVANDHD